MDDSKIEKLPVKKLSLPRLPSPFKIFYFSVLSLVLFVSIVQAESPTSSLTKAQLFEQAFGIPQPQYYEQETLLILVNGTAITSAEFEVNPLTSEIKIKKSIVAEIIQAAAKDDVDLQLASYTKADGYLNLDDMRQNGFAFTVSRRRQTINIQLPLEARKRQSLSSSNYNFNNDRLTEPRANTSGYINLYNYNSYNEDSSVDQRYQNVAFFESNIQQGPWNFQHEGYYTNVSSQDKSWTNAAARAVYAQPEKARHFIIGEQTPLNTNWQLNPSPLASGFDEYLVGFGVNKRAELNDFASISNSFFYDFSLDEPAEIQVFVNGDLTYQKSLQKGVYKLKDLQLDDGSNEIRIIIVKASGAVDEFTSSYFQSFDILDPGQLEYQISSGHLYKDERDLDKLDTDNTTSLLYLRYGATQKLTLGSYLQYQNDRQVGGIVLQTSNHLGLWSLDLSNANDAIAGSDYAGRLELVSNAIYAPFGFYDESFYSYGFIIESYGENYISDTDTIISSDYVNEINWLASPIFEWGFNRNIRISYSASYRKYRDARAYDKSYNINYSHRWREFDFQVKYERQSDQQINKSHQLLLTLTWNGSQGRNYIRTERNTDLNNETVTASFRPVNQAKQRYELTSFYEDNNNYRHSVETSYRDGYTNRTFEYQQSERDSAVSQNISATLEGHRGSIRARTSRRDNDSDNHLVVLEGALAFADGQVALSRPIEDSFAIVYPSDSLKGSVTTLSRNAQIDRFGPAVISDINAYQLQRIQIEDSNAQIGVDFGKQAFYIKPSYASGTAIEIGEGGSLLIIGVLVDNEGKPLALKTGYLVADSNPDKRLFFFSNRQGDFSLLGLEEGSYWLVVDNTSHDSVNLHIRSEASNQGLIDFGDFTVNFKGDSNE
jgi:outer membrane usher protein